MKTLDCKKCGNHVAVITSDHTSVEVHIVCASCSAKLEIEAKLLLMDVGAGAHGCYSEFEDEETED